MRAQRAKPKNEIKIITGCDELGKVLLGAAVPRQRSTLVHGPLRLHNECLFRQKRAPLFAVDNGDQLPTGSALVVHQLRSVIVEPRHFGAIFAEV